KCRRESGVPSSVNE
ncbi:hypothetical protein V3C99_016450, partial [Haemonchus contortus]